MKSTAGESCTFTDQFGCDETNKDNQDFFV